MILDIELHDHFSTSLYLTFLILNLSGPSISVRSSSDFVVMWGLIFAPEFLLPLFRLPICEQYILFTFVVNCSVIDWDTRQLYYLYSLLLTYLASSVVSRSTVTDDDNTGFVGRVSSGFFDDVVVSKDNPNATVRIICI